MKKKISITLKDWELQKIQEALEARALARYGSNRKKFSAFERNLLIKTATWFLTHAIIELKPSAMELVASMSFNTNEQNAAFDPAKAAKKPQPPKSAPEATPFQMDWFREHFPHRCI